MADLSVVLTAADGLEYTKNCLKLLLPQLTPEDELIVVNDDSTDGTAEWLTGLSGIGLMVKVVKRRQRLGHPAAVNRGLQECAGREVLVLHNDTYLLPDTVARLREALGTDPRLGAVSPMTVATQNTYSRLHTPPYHTVADLAEIVRAREAEVGPWRVRWTLTLDDYCVLFRWEALQKVGGFDTRFSPRYFAMDDMAVRLWQAGWCCAVANHLIVHHEAQRAIRQKETARAWYRENQHRFEKKWGFIPLYSLNVNDLLVRRIDLGQPDLSVLDVGCAGGGNLMRLAQLRPDARRCGIELNEGAAKLAGCFGEVCAADVTQLERPDWEGRFSYILCGDLIEHLADPLPVVKKLGSFLKPDTGRLVVSLPNVLFYQVWQDMIQGQWTYRNNGVLDRTHLRFFTRQSGLALMEEAGLTAESVDDNEFYVRRKPVPEEMIDHLLKTPGASITRQDLVALQWIIEAWRPKEAGR